MTTRLHVGIDCDEVLAQLHRPWIRWLRNRYPNNARAQSVQTFSEWDVHKLIDLTWEEFCEFISPVIYDLDVVEPYQGAQRELALLVDDRRYKISIVTHCINGTEEAKERWLKRHGFLPHGVEFISTADKTLVDIDVLVDDAPHHIAAAVDCGIQTIGVRRPHNHEADPDYWIRAYRQLPAVLGTIWRAWQLRDVPGVAP